MRRLRTTCANLYEVLHFGLFIYMELVLFQRVLLPLLLKAAQNLAHSIQAIPDILLRALHLHKQGLSAPRGPTELSRVSRRSVLSDDILRIASRELGQKVWSFNEKFVYTQRQVGAALDYDSSIPVSARDCHGFTATCQIIMTRALVTRCQDSSRGFATVGLTLSLP